MTRASRQGLVRAASLSVVALTAASNAQEAASPPVAVPASLPEPATDPTPEPTPTPAPSLFEASGFVDVYYGYCFNGVDPSLRVFDVQHDAFSLSLAEVAIAKSVTPSSRVGFRADIDLGKTADIVASLEPDAGDREIDDYVQQAYVSVLVGSGVQVDAGKFVTPAGAEVIESQDNWNYTRSILFGYAIPFYHFGVRAAAPLGAGLRLAGYVVNGWNNGGELDGAKAFALSATFQPRDSFTWVGTFMAGKEGEGLATRHLLDTAATVAVTPRLSLMANLDYGEEGASRWWGIAAYAKLQATPSWSLVGRYEYVDDTRGGFMAFGTRVRSVTFTSDHTVAGSLRTRLEYRTDLADAAPFPKDDGSTVRSQTTLTVGLVYAFDRRF